MKVVCVSGGFDPVHIGHLKLLKNAKKLGDKLIVILNNDNWLKLKKGCSFMPENDRKEIMKSFKFVDDVVITKHKVGSKDMSVCAELSIIKPDIFANGGDRKSDNVPEIQLCKELGIKLKFNIGGSKIQSSSKLLAEFEKKIKKINNKK